MPTRTRFTHKTVDNVKRVEVDELLVDTFAIINETRYITDETQLPLDPTGTKYILTPGSWIFTDSQPVVVTRPIEINPIGNGYTLISGQIFYANPFVAMFSQAFDTQISVVLFLRNLTVFGSFQAPSGTMFAYSYIGGTRPVIIMEFTQAILFGSVGEIAGARAVTLRAYSQVFCAGGLTFTNHVGIISGNRLNLENAAGPIRHFTFSGTGSDITPAIQFSQVYYRPSFPTEVAFQIDSNLLPLASFQNSTFDKRITSLAFFYGPTGLNETSKYVKSLGISNLPDSKTLLQVAFSVDSTTIVTTINKWEVVKLDPAAVAVSERIGLDVPTFKCTVESLENVNVTPIVSLSAVVTNGNPVFNFSLFRANEVLTGIVVDTVLNVFEKTAHGLSNGATVWLVDSTTVPSPLNDDGFYYVVNAVANTFQLALTSGGAAIDIITTGAGVVVIEMVSSVYVANAELTNSVVRTTNYISNINFQENDIFTFAINNRSNTANLVVDSFNFVVKN